MGGVNWLSTPAHSRWLEEEGDSLLAFGQMAVHPEGGFGWLDDDGDLDLSHDVELWITCRMTHSFALAAMMGRPGATAYVDHGLAALTGRLHDELHGGWYAAVGEHNPNDAKEAYGHAFVILAAASATAANRPGARDLLERALAVHTDRFWDESEGMSRESFSADWTEEEQYRGINANMHTVEAYLAASDVLGDPMYLRRAWRIIQRAMGFAEANNWLLPEHFSIEWEPQLEFNRETPAHPFRPFGATIGHSFEWARLTLQAAAALRSLGEDDGGWALSCARSLYDAGVAQGWYADGADGFVYTIDWDGTPVVRGRMHWVVAEAIGAAAVLYRESGDEVYAEQYQTWWDYAANYLIDVERGSWLHEVGTDNEPSATVWAGKPDIYHALQATLIPRLPVAPALAASLRDGNLD
ncbi:Mannose or cellobiose epimerase, N-acyl-D-glucosamine 2-epimerase family [Ruaniaceae bacterium KH17]|nr:Mannose or cellobiose epimerase, N-acyl-D-glucosamine 2-epimerase family [Ruaniaceae bacterium KH17]